MNIKPMEVLPSGELTGSRGMVLGCEAFHAKLCISAPAQVDSDSNTQRSAFLIEKRLVLKTERLCEQLLAMLTFSGCFVLRKSLIFINI